MKREMMVAFEKINKMTNCLSALAEGFASGDKMTPNSVTPQSPSISLHHIPTNISVQPWKGSANCQDA